MTVWRVQARRRGARNPIGYVSAERRIARLNGRRKRDARRKSTIEAAAVYEIMNLSMGSPAPALAEDERAAVARAFARGA